MQHYPTIASYTASTTASKQGISTQTVPPPRSVTSDATHARSSVTRGPTPVLTTPQSLRINILTINVCGLKSKLLLEDFMNFIMNYDVVCMCETRCDDADTKNIKNVLEKAGFNFVYKNRSALSRYKSGGLLIAVKNTLNIRWTEMKSGDETLLSICVYGRDVGLEKNLLITCVYIPPSHSRYGKREHFDELDEFFLSHSDCFHVVSGDFNAHTGTLSDVAQVDEDLRNELPSEIDVNAVLIAAGYLVNRVNEDCIPDRSSYGRRLVEVCKNNNVVIFNGRIGDDMGTGKCTTTYNTTIDYVIGTCNIVKHVKKFKVLDFEPLYSDVHCGLQTILEFPCVMRQMWRQSSGRNETPSVRPGQWRNEKKEEYVSQVDTSRVQHLLNSVDDLTVDDITHQLKQVLIDPALKVFPQKSKSKYIKKSNNANMNGYDKQCYSARKAYHKAKNKYNKHKSVATYNAMKVKSKKYKKEITRVKNKENYNIVQKLRENKSKDPKSYWKILKGDRSNKESDITLDAFYDHFKGLLADDDQDMQDGINYNINRESDTPILNDPITSDEIKRCIIKLKNNKSPGSDYIINEYIKSTQNLLCPLYVKLFNKILDEGVFPLEWTTGVIVAIYKNKGDVNDTNNYRGITLLSCMGKLFTSILNDRLRQYSEANQIINETQAGFRQQYSTLDHIFLLKCIIDLFKWKKRKLFCLFIDYKKAFDMIWREGLWYKLVRDNVNGKLLNVIHSMYRNIKSCVMMNQQMSDTFTCGMGVRQGENLSPLLFAFYVNDLQEKLIDCNCNYLDFDDHFLNVYLKILVLMYADDTVILCDSETNMNQALTALHSYCSDWKLKVNCDKTKIVVFSRGQVQTNRYNFQLGGEDIEVVSEYKYLGVLFNYNGRFRKGELALKEQATKALYSLIGTSRRYDLPVDIQIELFNMMVVPVLTYGCEIWGDNIVREVELLHMKFMKHVLYVHKFTSTDMVYGELGVYPLEITIKSRMINYWSRVIMGKNTKLSYVLYNCLLQLHTSGVYLSPWLECIKNICIECGMPGVWMSQTVNNPKWFKKAVEQKLRDIWITKWYGNVTSRGVCSTYKLYKEVYGMEDYLVKLNKNKRISLSKLRMGNNKLPVISGRHSQIAREQRLCTKCNDGSVGDEYHVMLECQNQNIVELRNKYMPECFRLQPNQFKFIRLMQSKNEGLLAKLAQFVNVLLKFFR